MSAAIGLPQIVALLILVQRGAEEVHSARNTRALLARGAREEGANYYPVVAVVHMSWIASLFFLIPPDAQPFWPMIGLYVVLQAARYWVIATLGPYWTHHIITLDEAPIVSSGAYRFVKHPNYAITIAETLLLPVAFSAVALALIMTAIWVAVLNYKIRLEDAALATRILSSSALRRSCNCAGVPAVVSKPCHWRPLVAILASIALFAALFSTLGLVAACIGCVLVAGTATAPVRWAQLFLLGPVLAGFSALLFVKGLGLPFRLWPSFLPQIWPW